MPPLTGVIILATLSLTFAYLLVVIYHVIYIDEWQTSDEYIKLQIGITDTAVEKVK